MWPWEFRLVFSIVFILVGLVIALFPHKFLFFRVRAPGSGAFPQKTVTEYAGKENGTTIMRIFGIIALGAGVLLGLSLFVL